MSYQLTPTGIVLLGAMNGINQLSVESNTSPLTLRFDESDIYNKSKPQLEWETAKKVISFMLFHGIIKKAAI